MLRPRRTTSRVSPTANDPGEASPEPSWRTVLSIDLRALAALRVGLGLVLLADLALRATDLTAHYTDRGVLPSGLLLKLSPEVPLGSLHLHASGSPDAVAAIFVVHAAFAVALVLGWRTRLATVVCWLLLVSLLKRAPSMTHGGDQLLGMLLFWGMFLPLGARYSLDARRAGTTHRGAMCSVASAALLVQVALVYWLSLLLRTTPIWWEGEALYYALQLDFWVTRPGLVLRELRFLHEPLTYLTLAIEMLGPLMCFIPRWSAWTRPLAFLLFTGLHASFGLFLSLGTFAWISVLSWVPFLPAWIWNRAEAPRTGKDRGGRLYGSSRVVNACAAVFALFVLVLTTQTRGFPFETDFLPADVHRIGWHLGIQQSWTMFTPNPPVQDGWFLFEGRTADGARRDLLTGGPSWGSRKPVPVTETFPSHRWNTLLFRMRDSDRRRRLRPMAAYLCREGHWQSDGPPARERSVHVWFFFERTTAPGAPPARPKRRRVLTYECGDRSRPGAVR